MTVSGSLWCPAQCPSLGSLTGRVCFAALLLCRLVSLRTHAAAAAAAAVPDPRSRQDYNFHINLHHPPFMPHHRQPTNQPNDRHQNDYTRIFRMKFQNFPILPKEISLFWLEFLN